MNEKELIEETVGGSIERIKKELVHILVDDEEIKSLIISECVDILNERLISELEEIKAEIIKGKCKYCDIDSNIQKCHEEHNIALCDVYDDLAIIDNHIAELKGE